MPHGLVVLRNDLMPGDWIKMAGVGFDIYGKVTDWNPQSKQVQIVTSTIIPSRSIKRVSPAEMDIEKIDVQDVPERARKWILERIKNPPAAPKGPYSTLGRRVKALPADRPDANPDPRRITGP